MIIALQIASLALAGRCLAADADYRDQVKEWRRDYQAHLTAEDGWLSVNGLFWLREGENRFGSSPINDIVLPEKAAPAQAGVFIFHDGKTTVKIEPGVTATMNGKPVNEAGLTPDDKASHLKLGDLTLYVHASGKRYGIRLKDKDSPARRGFHGLKWFPIDPKWRAAGRFMAYPKPKTVDVQNVMGDIDQMTVPGYVEFSLEGKTLRLEPEVEDDGTYEFVFRDLTSGVETYGAARFLDTPAAEKDGTVVLDFNEAYNPPCAYNRFTTCPMPTPDNRLSVRIAAGEKTYHR